MNLIETLKAEYEAAVEDYLAAWHYYDTEFVHPCRGAAGGHLWPPHRPASRDGQEACREIARAGQAMDAARAKYEEATAMADQLDGARCLSERTESEWNDELAAQLEGLNTRYLKQARRNARLKAVVQGRRWQARGTQAALSFELRRKNEVQSKLDHATTQIAALTEILRAPLADASTLTPAELDVHTARIVKMFAGQTITREDISRRFNAPESITKRALFEAWAAGKCQYDGTAFTFGSPQETTVRVAAEGNGHGQNA